MNKQAAGGKINTKHLHKTSVNLPRLDFGLCVLYFGNGLATIT